MTDLEVEFADGFTEARLRARFAGEATEGAFADDYGSSFRFLTDRDLVWAVDFVVGENAILEDEPAGTPAPPVVDALVENARDSTPYNVVDLDLALIRR